MSGPSGTPSIRFHHVGYAVSDIAVYRTTFFDPMFTPLEVSEPVADPIQRVRVAFAQMAGGTVIELVEPMDADSPVAAVIGSPRGGIYHLCYEVDDLEVAIQAFRAKRCLPLGKPAPAAAFNMRRIIFLMTPQRDLIELVEARAVKS